MTSRVARAVNAYRKSLSYWREGNSPRAVAAAAKKRDAVAALTPAEHQQYLDAIDRDRRPTARPRANACTCAPNPKRKAGTPRRALKRADRFAQLAKRAAQSGHPGLAAQLYAKAAKAERPRPAKRNPKTVRCVVTLTRAEWSRWQQSPGARLKLLSDARKVAKRHQGAARVMAPGGHQVAVVG